MAKAKKKARKSAKRASKTRKTARKSTRAKIKRAKTDRATARRGGSLLDAVSEAAALRRRLAGQNTFED